MLPQWDWQALTLPPRNFSWRVRGNALYWSRQERDSLEAPRDFLLATSMVDLAALRGLVPSLGRVPAALYFHENQFDYPSPRQPQGLLEMQIVSLYAALASQRLLFNSEYNRQGFLDGCSALLAKLPDLVPPGIVSDLRARSQVLPVPLDLPGTAVPKPAWPGARRTGPGLPLRLVWVGRLEHDKGPDSLLCTLTELEHSGLDYEVAVAGQQFRAAPPAFETIRRDYAHRLVQFGFVADDSRYRGLLAGADVVLSTALHEFQGLAVLQAVASGALPAVPDRLVYPEIYPARFRYASFPDNPQREGRAAAELVRRLAREVRAGGSSAPDVSAFHAAGLASRYQAVLREVAAGGAG